jgi:hypothetical protein
MKKYLLLTLSVIAIIVSCNKKPVVTPGRSDMLRTGKWSIESGTVIMKLPDGRDTILNYLNFLPFCHQDDYMVFHEGSDAAMFSAGNKCNAGDPDSFTFKWDLTTNDNYLSLYHGFDFIYGITDTILLPFHFDTLAQIPDLVLDTIHGVFDTLPGYTRTVIILDTIWDMKFDSVSLKYNNIQNSQITDFSQSGFTLHFWVYSQYPDSTGHHTGRMADPLNPTDSLDWNPIWRRDTLKYTIRYRNN